MRLMSVFSLCLVIQSVGKGIYQWKLKSLKLSLRGQLTTWQSTRTHCTSRYHHRELWSVVNLGGTESTLISTLPKTKQWNHSIWLDAYFLTLNWNNATLVVKDSQEFRGNVVCGGGGGLWCYHQTGVPTVSLPITAVGERRGRLLSTWCHKTEREKHYCSLSEIKARQSYL